MNNKEVHNKWVKICWNKGFILHTIISIYIMYEFCIQIVYIMFMMHIFCRSELMHTKCIQYVCIQNVSRILTKQNLAGIVLLILFPKCIQKFVKMWYTFCIHSVYILYIPVVCILYNFCIQNVYAVSVWEGATTTSAFYWDTISLKIVSQGWRVPPADENLFTARCKPSLHIPRGYYYYLLSLLLLLLS